LVLGDQQAEAFDRHHDQLGILGDHGRHEDRLAGDDVELAQETPGPVDADDPPAARGRAAGMSRRTPLGRLQPVLAQRPDP
jgi:hypothetical protein